MAAPTTTTLDLLHHSTLTAAVNERKPPRTFLQMLLRGRVELVATDSVEIGIWKSDRKSAPFVEECGEATLVKHDGEEFQQVKIPNIRIKCPTDPCELLTERRPGSPIFIQPGRSGQNTLLAQAQRVVANRLEELDWRLTNTEEWMYARMLEGQIVYQVEDQANFQITYNLPAPVVLADPWTSPTSQVSETVITTRNQMSDCALAPAVALLGLEAGAAFRANSEVQSLLDNRRIQSGGTLDISRDLTASGGLFLGNFMGIDWWEYSRSVEGPDGTVAPLVDPKRAYFIDTSRQADFRTYYGPIKDIDAMDSRQVVARRFAKQWIQPDPSARVYLMAARPLPVPARPQAIQTYQVVP